MDTGDDAAEHGAPEERRARNRRHRLHAAPAAQIRQRPDRDLLQADDVRPVRGNKLDHLTQERASLGRHRVAVEEVPRADEH